jgi:hypothetical protein
MRNTGHSTGSDPGAAGTPIRPNAPALPAKALLDHEIAHEIRRIGKEWDDMFADPDFEGHSGSPGEWMVERLNELETEQERRRP